MHVIVVLQKPPHDVGIVADTGADFHHRPIFVDEEVAMGRDRRGVGISQRRRGDSIEQCGTNDQRY